MVYCCKTDGRTITVRDEQNGAANCVIGPVEWGVWTATNDASMLSLRWSKLDTAFDAMAECQITKLYVPTGRLTVEGSEKKTGRASLMLACSTGARVCELYIHKRANGLVGGLTILPISDAIWDYK
jgi:hypothetical protein